MSPYARELAAAIKASPQAQAALQRARPEAPYPAPTSGPCALLRAPNPAREAQRKRIEALIRDHKDIMPDWTALASMAQERGLWPATTRHRDIIPVLRATAHRLGLAHCPGAYALDLTGALT